MVIFNTGETVTLGSWNGTELLEMYDYESDGR
jgi:hypothetical protein